MNETTDHEGQTFFFDFLEIMKSADRTVQYNSRPTIGSGALKLVDD
jgi:hypothetical protein